MISYFSFLIKIVFILFKAFTNAILDSSFSEIKPFKRKFINSLLYDESSILGIKSVIN